MDYDWYRTPDAEVLALDGDADANDPFGLLGASATPALEEDEGVVAEEDVVVVDETLAPGDVLARVEAVVAALVEDVASGVRPTLQMVSRRSAVYYQQQQDGGHEQAALGLRDRVQTRCLMANGGAGAFPFARVFQVLAVAHELVRTGRQATQRDIYYKLLSPPLFNNAHEVNAAIMDIVALLRVPRSLLGICCASRGAVSGKLCIKDGPMSPWQDCCTSGIGGRSIPGSLPDIQSLGFRSSARYLIVIEKDAIFQALTQDRIFDELPCILVTAKGVPDIATRAFCSRVMASVPGLTVLGLVDWNPSGLVILRTYKYGSHRTLEGSRFTLPSLRWLGLRSGMLDQVDSARLLPLTRRDRSLAASLLPSLGALGEAAWCAELRAMAELEGGCKADIEALYSAAGGMAGMGRILVQAVVRGDYV